MKCLLDANVLIATAVSDHVHHYLARDWLIHHKGGFATCPTTQGALVRLVIRHGGSGAQAMTLLESITSNKAHSFWPADLSYQDVTLAGLMSHRQVTDAYLAALARHNGGSLVTMDSGLAALHSDVTTLLES